jgi:hypothetical protein
MTPCSFVDKYDQFGGTCYLPHKSGRDTAKHWYLSTRLYGITCRKLVILILYPCTCSLSFFHIFCTNQNQCYKSCHFIFLMPLACTFLPIIYFTHSISQPDDFIAKYPYLPQCNLTSVKINVGEKGKTCFCNNCNLCVSTAIINHE